MTTSGSFGRSADAGALLIAGATSGAGKSTVAAALGRLLARGGGARGPTVAPFKAQNMSNHAAVTADGGEIGRAQATQAAACGVDFDRRMNPVLLKPSSGGRSHLVVMGDERSMTDMVGYGPTSAELKPVVLDALTSLRRQFDWVVAEGAGGAAEINLLDRDLVNLPLARAAGMKAVLVVDIDRGGAFAAAYGTIGLVPDELRATIGGVLFNRFRGDPTMLDDGISSFEARTGVPVLGVLPALDPVPILGVEDALDIAPGAVPTATPPGPGPADRPLRVAAVRLPHLANPSDLDPLTIEPAVSLRWTTRPEDLTEADLVVLPGSRATVRDLVWLRRSGLADALRAMADGARPCTVVGICGGFQMLGRTIVDELESGRGRVPALGLLDVTTTFTAPKIVRRSRGSLSTETGTTVPLTGYQIRWGRQSGSASPWLTVDGEPEGAVARRPSGPIHGTSLHGLFDDDGFRTLFLSQVAERCGRRYEAAPRRFADAFDAQHDRLADWLAANSDVDRLVGLAAEAVGAGSEPGW